jgi:hypothetical protein
VPDDTEMTADQFYATRTAGVPARVVPSRAEFLSSVGNGGSILGLTLLTPPGQRLPPVADPFDDVKVGYPGAQGVLAVR